MQRSSTDVIRGQLNLDCVSVASPDDVVGLTPKLVETVKRLIFLRPPVVTLTRQQLDEVQAFLDAGTRPT